MTPAELGELEREILAVLDRWERRDPPTTGRTASRSSCSPTERLRGP
ncbi:hypothetical protein [Actinomadura sp. B10D3]